MTEQAKINQIQSQADRLYDALSAAVGDKQAEKIATNAYKKAIDKTRSK